jgi:1,4-dihydroxy-2-naphthoate octaprenyltransferase
MEGMLCYEETGRMKPSLLKELLRLSRPWVLLSSLFFYAVGVGIAQFLGNPIDLSNYLIGQACVLLLAFSSAYLSEYFSMLERPMRRWSENSSDQPEELQRLRTALLQAAAVALTVGALLTVMLIIRGVGNPTVIIFLGAGFLLSFFYAVPPLRLVKSGYGELVMALFLTGITPALAYALQTGETHRLLILLTFPLTAMFIATSLATELETYYADIKAGRQTLMVAVGWQRGMNLHNLMILLSYFLVGLAAALRLPWSLTWPMLLTAPLGFFQIWQMWQISNGQKPHWRLLRITALALMGIMVYLIAFALWTG